MENALRYSTASMLIVNGQIANQTGVNNRKQQYRELEDLYRMLSSARRHAGDRRDLLEQRLVAVAATHFQERGGDGGPGQLGYSTPGATEVIGDILLDVYRTRRVSLGRVPWRSIALQGAANVSFPPLQEHMLALLLSDDLEQVAAAAKALSNPSSLRLQGDAGVIGPLLEKLDAFVRAGRQGDADALVRFLSRVRWEFAEEDTEAERRFFELLVPRIVQSPVASAPHLLGRPAAEAVDTAGAHRASARPCWVECSAATHVAPPGRVRSRRGRRAVLAAFNGMDAALPEAHRHWKRPSRERPKPKISRFWI